MEDNRKMCVESSTIATENTNNNNHHTANINNNNNIIQTDTLNGTEESCLLGIDCNEHTTIGLVVPILADTTIHLDGDG